MDGIVIIYLFIFALGAYHFFPAGGLGGGLFISVRDK